MKAQNLIAGVAAVVFTAASLSVVNFNVPALPAPATHPADAARVTELAPVLVRPSAAEMRAAALLSDIGVAGLATVPVVDRLDHGGSTEQFRLLGSKLVMPYYSFGNTFGRISKE